MLTERMKIHGVIRGGVVIPDSRLTLPEGTKVEISFSATELPEELQEEFAAWDRASDNAWTLMCAELYTLLDRLTGREAAKTGENPS